MKKIKNTCLWALGVALALSSCETVHPYPRLSPRADQPRWIEGREVVKAENGPFKIVTAYDGMFQEYLTFDTEIKNLSDQPIEIAPSWFGAFYLDAQGDSLRNHQWKKFPLYFSALDPIEMQHRAAEEMRLAQKRHRNNTIFNVILGVGAIIAEVASSDRNSESAWRRSQNTEALVNLAITKQLLDDQALITRMDRLQYAKGNWAEETFRRTTLAPGTSVRGRVYVKFQAKARQVVLRYNDTHSTPISFIFDQDFKQ
jgi:hypothetical protein